MAKYGVTINHKTHARNVIAACDGIRIGDTYNGAMVQWISPLHGNAAMLDCEGYIEELDAAPEVHAGRFFESREMPTSDCSCTL